MGVHPGWGPVLEPTAAITNMILWSMVCTPAAISAQVLPFVSSMYRRSERDRRDEWDSVLRHVMGLFLNFLETVTPWMRRLLDMPPMPVQSTVLPEIRSEIPLPISAESGEKKSV